MFSTAFSTAFSTWFCGRFERLWRRIASCTTSYCIYGPATLPFLAGDIREGFLGEVAFEQILKAEEEWGTRWWQERTFQTEGIAAWIREETSGVVEKMQVVGMAGVEDVSWGLLGGEARMLHRPMKWLVLCSARLELLFQNYHLHMVLGCH